MTPRRSGADRGVAGTQGAAVSKRYGRDRGRQPRAAERARAVLASSFEPSSTPSVPRAVGTKKSARRLEIRPTGPAGLDGRGNAAGKPGLHHDRVGSQRDELARQTGSASRGAPHRDDDHEPPVGVIGEELPRLGRRLRQPQANRPRPEIGEAGLARPTATFAGATSSITSGASTRLGVSTSP